MAHRGDGTTMATRDFRTAFEMQGRWFEPAPEPQQIAGTLVYTPGAEVELHLHDSLDPIRRFTQRRTEGRSYPVLHGTTTSGEAVTLLSVQLVRSQLAIGSAGMGQPEELVSNRTLIGTHASPESLYRQIRFRVPALEVWLSKETVKRTVEHGPASERVWSFAVVTPDGPAIRVPAIEADLGWQFDFSSNSNPFKGVRVDMQGWLQITPDKPKSLDWLLEQKSVFDQLLTMLAGEPMLSDCIQLAVAGGDERVLLLIRQEGSAYCARTQPEEFFLALKDLEDPSEVIQCWFAEWQRMRMPLQLAVSTLNSTQLWLHVRFLSLMQALEGFHRSRFPGTYMADEDYYPVRQKITAAIPSELAADHREALKARLKYGNQISLRRRLNELTEKVPDPLREIVLGQDRRIPRSWTETRNYYTHWDEELRPALPKDLGLHFACVRLSVLLRLLYLQMVGVSASTLLKALNSGRSTVSRQIIHAHNVEVTCPR
ncbi:MAG: hypothetical protein H3C58_09935 [Fimbriimonadaceae bacterium]|nr:hypothetical protein [Fimbriimonadaceae bacterium]